MKRAKETVRNSICVSRYQYNSVYNVYSKGVYKIMLLVIVSGCINFAFCKAEIFISFFIS